MSDGEEEENDYVTMKVVLIGEMAVGKTSIITKFTTNYFSPYVLTSTGSTFFSKILKLDNDNKVKIQIWDTAGQEQYRSLAKLFYQNASAAILVYDITNEDTFLAIKDYWSNEIKNNSPADIIIAIVANKSDEYAKQKVPTEDGKALAKELNAIFVNTSAKEGDGIDNLFRTVAEKYIDPTKDISNTYMKREEMKEKNKKISLEVIKNNNTNDIKDSKNKRKKKNKCC